MNISQINEHDTSNMFDVLKNFPKQVEHSIEIGQKSPKFLKFSDNSNIILLGMGGSAIAGDLIKSLLYSLSKSTSFIVNRNYRISTSIDEKTCIIASSYSGNTEETLSAFDIALSKTNNIICISSGGELTRLAKKRELSLIEIPSGFQPRCALGYSFFPLLFTMMKSDVFNQNELNQIEDAIKKIPPILYKLSEIYSDLSPNNTAIQIAEKLYGTIPVIYSSSELLDSVNFRWRCQINENAKNLAYGNYLPEMSHNEINSFTYPMGFPANISMILFYDTDDHPRIKIRLDALSDILKDNVKHIIKISGNSDNFLIRMFEIIYLGDWVSFYLGILNGVNPTEIPIINLLKNRLSERT